MAPQFAAAVTATRAAIDIMCSLTIDCRCETAIVGMIRYQWPRTIAVDVVPSSAAEVRKLAPVSACIVAGRPEARLNACATIAINPAPTAVPTRAGRTAANHRPTVAQ